MAEERGAAAAWWSAWSPTASSALCLVTQLWVPGQVNLILLGYREDSLRALSSIPDTYRVLGHGSCYGLPPYRKKNPRFTLAQQKKTQAKARSKKIIFQGQRNIGKKRLQTEAISHFNLFWSFNPLNGS